MWLWTEKSSLELRAERGREKNVAGSRLVELDSKLLTVADQKTKIIFTYE